MPNTYVVVSYVPLLHGHAGQTIDTMDLPRLATYMDTLPGGVAEACLWAEMPDGPSPVLVIERMNEVLDHLIEWSEGVPQERFNLQLFERDNRYGLCLMPDLVKSRERYELAAKMLGRPIDAKSDDKFHFIFRPIIFTSGPGATNYKTIKSRLKSKVMVMFIDTNDMPRDGNLSKIDTEKVRELGMFRVQNDHFNYLQQVMDQQEADGHG